LEFSLEMINLLQGTRTAAAFTMKITEARSFSLFYPPGVNATRRFTIFTLKMQILWFLEN